MDEEHIDTIILDLKILSMVKFNEKLSIRKGHLQIDESSNLQFFKRWLFRDSRELVLVYIRELIRNIYTLLKEIKNECVIEQLVIELKHATNGLENLKQTYSSDPYMIVTFDNIMYKFKDLSFQFQLKMK